MKTFLLGLILGLLTLPLAGYFYFRTGHPPVAVTDHPFLLEKEIVRQPLHARIDKEMPKTAPIEASATNLEAGAHIYRQQCASCHGLYGRPSSFAAHMYPHAPQLWAPHSSGVVGVSDDPPGETYWKVANGIRLTGMPAFDKVLNQTQMWQVSLLLAHADQPLPADALTLLKQPLDLDPTAASPAPQSTAPAQKITDLKLDAMPSPIPPDGK
ncbi:c-type cytochrome [Silvibacterium acidisoli]|uniref:c-type cytochrome n=1 Tax=Acidobacteriaceae bacterium ZG23-2 TaxID=2883246 RepID=UPI00406C682D